MALNVRFRDKASYRFENFMARGGMSIFMSLLALFLLCFVFAILIRWIILLLFPGTDIVGNFFGHIWKIFLAMTDPGNMGEDTESSAWLKFTIIVAGILGVVIFSMLIAFITTQLEGMIHRFRKGRSKVIEDGQTLILGWNERVIDIIRELIIANESESRASVVILADRDKEEMDDEVLTLIADTKTTRIVTRSGSTSTLANLHKVNAEQAKSAIVLASCGHGATDEEKRLSDARVIKTVLALIGCQGGSNEINIVAELFEESSRELVETFESDRITTVDSWDILGKILVQTSRTSGLAVVYNEILSFDGGEMYFYNADWGQIPFYQLLYHFPDGVIMGVRRADGSLELRPAKEAVVNPDDEVLILAEDNSTIQYQKEPVARPRDFPYTNKERKHKQERELILGWHSVASIVVSEYADYLLQGSTIDIVVNRPSLSIKADVERLKRANQKLKINLIDKNPMAWEDLVGIDPFHYDNVIILSQSEDDPSPERTDSETMVILLLMRKMLRDNPERHKGTKLITQVLNSENQELITQTNVDDFIISNKLITMIFAQLSEEPRIKQLYDDMFAEEGSEIYLKPVPLYFDTLPVQATFADILAQVCKRDEICLGVRMGRLANDPGKNFGVKLNPPKDQAFTLSEFDSLVVLAENEL
jgi:hypothetical protein